VGVEVTGNNGRDHVVERRRDEGLEVGPVVHHIMIVIDHTNGLVPVGHSQDDATVISRRVCELVHHHAFGENQFAGIDDDFRGDVEGGFGAQN
jgi:hypothetical protein